jgi:hypothetical protein
MARVRIEHCSDMSDACELCGTSYAEGAKVFVDGVEVIDLKPVAHCTGGQHFDYEDIMRAVLRHFGHDLEPSTY